MFKDKFLNIYSIFYILNKNKFYKYDINNIKFLEDNQIDMKTFYKNLKKIIVKREYEDIKNILKFNFNDNVVLDILNRKKLKLLYPYNLFFNIDSINAKNYDYSDFHRFLKLNNLTEEEFFNNLIQIFRKDINNNILIFECTNTDVKLQFSNLFSEYIEESYIEEIFDIDLFDFKNYEIFGKEFLIFHDIKVLLKEKNILDIITGNKLIEKTKIFTIPFIYKGKSIIFSDNSEYTQKLLNKFKNINRYKDKQINIIKINKNETIEPLEKIFILMLKYLVKNINNVKFSLETLSKELTKEFIKTRLEEIKIKNQKHNKLKLYKEYEILCKLFHYEPINKTSFFSYVTLINNKINQETENIIKDYYIKN